MLMLAPERSYDAFMEGRSAAPLAAVDSVGEVDSAVPRGRADHPSSDGAGSDPSSQIGAAKARIRAAALVLFADQGYRAASVRDVMRACRLTPGALYAHYPSKESLLFDLIKEGHARLEEVLRSVSEQLVDSGPQRIAGLVYYHALYTIRNKMLARVAASGLEQLPTAMADEIRAMRGVLNGYFEDAYQQGVAEGTLDPTHANLTLLATLAGTHQLTMWFRGEGPLSPEEVARWHATMLLRIAMVGSATANEVSALVDSAMLPESPVGTAVP
jgi:AcrR family transcriptional regulator